MQSNSYQLRMAQRSYHCYSCNAGFRALTQVSEQDQLAPQTEVKCPTCRGEFIEEAKSFEQVRNQASPPQATDSAPTERSGESPTAPHPPLPQSVEPLRQVYHDTVIRRTYSPGRGWREHVTDIIEYHRHENSTSQQPSQRRQEQADFQIGPMTMAGGRDRQIAPSVPIEQLLRPQPHVIHLPLGSLPADLLLQALNDLPDIAAAQVPAGCPQTFIEGLPIKDPLQPEDVCSICMNACTTVAECCELPTCKHVFHRRCISEWLQEHQTCPVCRLRLVSPDQEEVPSRLQAGSIVLQSGPSSQSRRGNGLSGSLGNLFSSLFY